MENGAVERFADVAAIVTDYRKKRNEGLAVMPVYKSYDNLSKHLKLLTEQTFQDFDLIIVLSSLSDEKQVRKMVETGGNGYRFGVIICKRKEDTGSSGGFYTGERFALENGYKYIWIADDDCLPVDKELYRKSVEAHSRGNHLVFARPFFFIDGEPVCEGRGIHYYSLIDLGVLRRSGLHYNRMYIGADDAELWVRVMKTATPLMTDSRVAHPRWHSIFVDFERSLLYRVNHMLLGIPLVWMDYLYGFALLFPCYIIFGTERTRQGGFFMLANTILHRYGKAALMEKRARDEAPPPDYGLLVTPLASQKDSGFYYDYAAGTSMKMLFGLAKAVSGKRVRLLPINNYAVMLSMALSKETWISTKGGDYLLSRNSNIVFQALKLMLFGFLAPFFFLAGLVSLPINILRKPDTRWFGLEESERA